MILHQSHWNTAFGIDVSGDDNCTSTTEILQSRTLPNRLQRPLILMECFFISPMTRNITETGGGGKGGKTVSQVLKQLKIME